MEGKKGGRKKLTCSSDACRFQRLHRRRRRTNNAPRPQRVVLLRTGQELPFRYEDATLTVPLPPEFRDNGIVDVVKVELAAAAR